VRAIASYPRQRRSRAGAAVVPKDTQFARKRGSRSGAEHRRIAIGVSITRTLAASIDASPIVARGFAGQTATGHPNSSATNWTVGTNSYRVVLHCGLRDRNWYVAGVVNPSRP
jgi:hypothetical protein